ncbi:MAG: hypothetical protein IKB56_05685, partial [Clostridia bacterium]|nr:hypothetical protein [Clostridia bacterium]
IESILIEILNEKKLKDAELDTRMEEKAVITELEHLSEKFRQNLQYSQMEEYDKLEKLFEKYLKTLLKNVALRNFKAGLSMGLDLK